MIPKTIETIEQLENLTLTQSDLDEMAANLPTYPPLKPGGDCAVKEFHPDLSDEELDFLYKAYTEKYNGTMRKDGDWKPSTSTTCFVFSG